MEPPADMLIVAHDGFGPGPDDVGQGLEVSAGLQGLGDEIVVQVAGAEPAADACAFQDLPSSPRTR